MILGREGGGTQREGIGTCSLWKKGSFYRSVSTLLSLIVAPLLSERREENMQKPKREYKYCILRVLQKFICLYISQIQLSPEQNRALTRKDADSRVLRNSLTSLLPLPFKACSERIIDFHFLNTNKIFRQKILAAILFLHCWIGCYVTGTGNW